MVISRNLLRSLKHDYLCLFLISLFLLFSDLNLAFSQQFSSNIIVEAPIPNQWYKSKPSIDIDSAGNPSILWSTCDEQYNVVKFARSFNHGQSFDSLAIVDSIPNVQWWDFINTSLVKYDQHQNPSVCYYNWDSSIYTLKKSNNTGVSFTTTPFSALAGYNMIDLFFLNDSVGFLGYHYVSNNNIIILKTTDSGNSYFPLTVIDPGNFIAAPLLTFVQCGNGDILLFWTGIRTTTNNQVSFYNRSTDNCDSFGGKVQIDTVNVNSTGVSAVSFQNYVFIVHLISGGSITPKFVFRKSEDYGYTYSEPLILHDYGSSGITINQAELIKYNEHVGICVVWGQRKSVKFSYSTDLGETFYEPVSVTSSNCRREYTSLGVSDSGDVYVVSKIDSSYGGDDMIVVNKAELPVISSIKTNKTDLISDLNLYQNYPNPFNPVTTISFNLPQSDHVKLTIYDVTGRKNTDIVEGKMEAGEHSIQFDAHHLSSGVYFYRLQVGHKFVRTRKMILMR